MCVCACEVKQGEDKQYALRYKRVPGRALGVRSMRIWTEAVRSDCMLAESQHCFVAVMYHYTASLCGTVSVYILSCFVL